MNRKEHLEWAKNRAKEILENSTGMEAWANFVGDLGKHDELRDHIAIQLGMMTLSMNGFNNHETASFIDGFN